MMAQQRTTIRCDGVWLAFAVIAYSFALSAAWHPSNVKRNAATRSPLFSSFPTNTRSPSTLSQRQKHSSFWRRAKVLPDALRVRRLLATQLGESTQESNSMSEQRQQLGGFSGWGNLPQEELLHRMELLQQENRLLSETVRQLELDNEDLIAMSAQQRIVLETFEGEGEEWCDALEEGACPVEPRISFGQALRDRAVWLVGLLLMQSFSGIILARNEALIANHPFIVYFLTMLVGAGGNAGNQASVRVIRGLALGTLNPTTQGQFLARELKMAIALSSILTLAGFVRAAAFSTPFPETIAITSALFLIVFSSICLGAVLPLALKRISVDPAHSSTSIQVIMDILGVILAVSVSSLLLDSPLGNFLTSKLSGS